MTSDATDDDILEDATGTKSDPGAGLADEPHEGLAADAAAYLERSGAAIESLGGIPQEIDRQAACLIVWARGKGVLLAQDYMKELFKHITMYRIRLCGTEP